MKQRSIKKVLCLSLSLVVMVGLALSVSSVYAADTTNNVYAPSGYYDTMSANANNHSLICYGQVYQWTGKYLKAVYTDINGVDIRDAKKIAAAAQHTLVLNEDGTVQAFGNDYIGASQVPSDLKNVTEIAATDGRSYALKSDGTVVKWGYTDDSEKTLLSTLNNVKAIAASPAEAIALKNDGTLFTWSIYESEAYRSIPIDLSKKVVSIAAGRDDSCHIALLEDGTVETWKFNGSTNRVRTVPNVTNAIAVAAGGSHFLALKKDGTVVAWGGDNAYGQLNVPSDLKNVVSIAANDGTSYAMKNDGRFVAWGKVYQ